MDKDTEIQNETKEPGRTTPGKSMPQKKDAMLGTEGIGKLLVKMSLPAIVGMVVNALYNVVDTIFIGRGVGTMGIAGLTLPARWGTKKGIA